MKTQVLSCLKAGMLLKRKVINRWQVLTRGRSVRKESEHAPTIRNLLVPNPRSARAGSCTGSITNSLALG